jgi:hypothetical protein
MKTKDMSPFFVFIVKDSLLGSIHFTSSFHITSYVVFLLLFFFVFFSQDRLDVLSEGDGF